MSTKTILCTFVLLLLASTGKAEENNLTKIQDIANKHECTLLGNDSNISTPWQTDISNLTGKKGDVVFLCELKKEPGVFRVVIVSAPDRNIWKGCSTHVDIRGVAPHPSGLAVRTSNDANYYRYDLSHWYYEDRSQGPFNIMPTEPIIDTSDDVAGDLFYCFEGKWLSIFVH